jgi:hypothetical protein
VNHLKVRSSVQREKSGYAKVVQQVGRNGQWPVRAACIVFILISTCAPR